MKYKFISIIIASICLVSCSDFLQRDSLVQLSSETFWETESDAIEGVNAIYNGYRSYTTQALEYAFYDDFSDISFQTRINAMITGNAVKEWSVFRNPWGYLYRTIYRANTAIQEIPGIDMDEALKQRLIGEAKFLRALSYFTLTDLYGGVPIYDTPMNLDEAYKPRDTKEDVYAFILQDLTDAIAVLDESYAEYGRATKWAAMSLRGKTKLYMKNYSEAAADFKNVIDNSDRDLHPEYDQLFNYKWENNKEIIFDIQYLMVSGYGHNIDKIWGNKFLQSAGWEQTCPSRELVDSYEEADGTPFDWNNYKDAWGNTFEPDSAYSWLDEATVRKIYENRDPRMHQTMVVPWGEIVGRDNLTFIYKWPSDTSDPECYYSQWPGMYSWKKFVHQGTENSMPNASPNNIPIIRFADVLLMYAEAQNEANGPDESVYNAINRVRARVNMPPIATGDQAHVRERIRHERKVEFPGEGLRYSDIRRWGIAEELCNNKELRGFIGKDSKTRKFSAREYLFPIPSTEIEINPLLEQNPGWE